MQPRWAEKTFKDIRKNLVKPQTYNNIIILLLILYKSYLYYINTNFDFQVQRSSQKEALMGCGHCMLAVCFYTRSHPHVRMAQQKHYNPWKLHYYVSFHHGHRHVLHGQLQLPRLHPYTHHHHDDPVLVTLQYDIQTAEKRSRAQHGVHVVLP